MKDEVQETEKRLETLSGKVANAMRVEKAAFTQRADGLWARMRDEYLVQANLAIKEGESALTRGDGYFAQLCQKKAESYLQRVKDLT